MKIISIAPLFGLLIASCDIHIYGTGKELFHAQQSSSTYKIATTLLIVYESKAYCEKTFFWSRTRIMIQFFSVAVAGSILKSCAFGSYLKILEIFGGHLGVFFSQNALEKILRFLKPFFGNFDGILALRYFGQETWRTYLIVK